MTNHELKDVRLVLTDDAGLGQLRVEMEAFFDFSFTLAEDLEDLVALWAHRAAPNANRPAPRRS